MNDETEQVKIALNALARLENAEQKLSDGQRRHLESVRECLRRASFSEAKVGLIKMLEVSDTVEDLWLALAQVLVALGEKNVQNLVDYVKGTKH